MKRLTHVVLLFLCISNAYAFPEVELQTGRLFLKAQNFRYIDRIYRGGASHTGILGNKWSSVLDSAVTARTGSDRYYVYDGAEGRNYRFKKGADSHFSGKQGVLNEHETGFRWEYQGKTYLFNLQGRLTRFSADKFTICNVDYTDSSKLDTVNCNSGDQFVFHFYKDGKVKSIQHTDKKGDTHVAKFNYESGNLITVESDMQYPVNFEIDIQSFEYRYDDYNDLTYVEFQNYPPITVHYQDFDGAKIVKEIRQTDNIETYDYLLLEKTPGSRRFLVNVNESTSNSASLYKLKVEYLDSLNKGKYISTQEIRRYRNGRLISGQK
jgi:hypothetical protein